MVLAVSVEVSPESPSTSCTGWLLVDRPPGTPLGLVLAGAVLYGGVLLVTGLVAVPLHRRLDAGWDAAAHRRLLRADALRVGLATAGVLVALALVATG